MSDNNNQETSGYTTDIGSELNEASPIDVQKDFSDIRELYTSPMGHTRLYTAKRYGKLYTLKGLKPDYMYTPVYRQALTKEFEIGLQLDHPNICRTISLEQVSTLGTVIVMEHIDGDTLQHLLDTNALTAELANSIARQTAAALDYIHSKQITHRDLKPTNIMITHNGRNVKVIDFSLSDSDTFTVLKLPAGTSGYIAPELYLPDAKSTPEADTYSYGVVLKDMAKATKDQSLARMAKACMRRKPSLRPKNKAEIFTHAHTPKWQWLYLLIMSIISLLLATYICVTLFSNHNEEPATDFIPDDTLYIGNTVHDFGQQ